MVTDAEEKELTSAASPIVLLRIKPEAKRHLYLEGIAAGLDRMGIMTAYTPLYDLLLSRYNKPVIATSGNISNSTIIYQNDKALEELSGIADAILLNDRDIVVPQDDGVVKYSAKYKQKAVIRRSRGSAPSYINPALKPPSKSTLAMGAGLKSTFSLNTGSNLYISQYLGDTTTGFEAQENYKATLDHFFDIFSFSPELICIDKHPDYFSSRLGKQLAMQYGIKYKSIQHHKAHFSAVLAENGLLEKKEKILGVVWDGTGYGDDGNIWGGEFFVFSNGKIHHFDRLDYYDFILGDKMVKEPRISALAISKNLRKGRELLKSKFSSNEWNIYSKILSSNSNLKTSSAGRLFDAAASVIAGIDKQSYAGHAAMLLESLASSWLNGNTASLHDSYIDDNITGRLPFIVMNALTEDINKNTAKEKMAYRFHLTLCHYVLNMAEKAGVKRIAFSGGVFQNTVLVDLLIQFAGEKYKLYFHKELSPNDECISLGQIMAATYDLV